MGLNLEQKQAVVAEVAAQLANAQAVIVAEYRGLDVGRVTQLRAKARKSGLYLRVLKNTLARRAVKGTPFESLSDQMVGPLMYGIAADPVAGAVKNAKAGQVQFRADKSGVVQCTIGRASFTPEQLRENLAALVDALNKAKPAATKGIFLKKLSVSSTMGLGVKVDPASLSAQP